MILYPAARKARRRIQKDWFRATIVRAEALTCQFLDNFSVLTGSQLFRSTRYRATDFNPSARLPYGSSAANASSISSAASRRLCSTP